MGMRHHGTHDYQKRAEKLKIFNNMEKFLDFISKNLSSACFKDAHLVSRYHLIFRAEELGGLWAAANETRYNLYSDLYLGPSDIELARKSNSSPIVSYQSIVDAEHEGRSLQTSHNHVQNFLELISIQTARTLNIRNENFSCFPSKESKSTLNFRLRHRIGVHVGDHANQLFAHIYEVVS